MEENRINKTSQITTRIYPETKKAFLDKLAAAGIPEYCSFLARLMEKWAKYQKEGSNSVTYSFRSLLSFMPVQTSRIARQPGKISDKLHCSMYGINKRCEWVTEFINAARTSPYNKASNVVRCLVYAIILAPSELINNIVKEISVEQLKNLRLENSYFWSNIKPDIYNRIESLYNQSPTSITRCILDILLLDEEGTLHDILINNLSYKHKRYIDSYSNKIIGLNISNDLYRLKIYNFMATNNIQSRSKLIQMIIDLALRLPEIVDINLLNKYQDNQEDDPEVDTYKRMSNQYYRYTGL